ncbi:hypothetical protein CS063_02380 [Sporanaerobium hydrogeniformans]|uniref:Uncharacterized protein n=1 Tax=Sporanaerobium hydrogeniformans TaxID=3072179 RepID=A0AC61DGD4_9FIRM|nr:hypothetical protein [Sporanaerobium hydrogeniformans]PHV72344.1 hypothetical protein CS063_02380 [Sporanaerobium hydrogeniformans]
MQQSHNSLNNLKINQKGEAMLITTILLLVLVVIMAGLANISGMQWNLAYLQRNTSNTYYLAQSGVEKGADIINKALQAKLPEIAERVRDTYLTEVTSLSQVRSKAADLVDAESNLYYTNGLRYGSDGFYIEQEALSRFIKKELYHFIATHYSGKTMNYELKGDGQHNLDTKIEIAFNPDATYDITKIDNPTEKEYTDKPRFLITATAKVMEGSKVKDIKKVEGRMELDIPSKLNNILSEAYNWLYNPPEILDSAITCFGDMVVTSGAELVVEGDIRVKGTQGGKTTTRQGILVGSDYAIDLVVPPITSTGGLVVSNGGSLTVKKDGAAIFSRPETSYLSNKNRVVMSNSQRLLASSSAISQPTTSSHYTSNSGSIYCEGNVIVTQGWAANDADVSRYNTAYRGKLDVVGDIIANTVAICDDAQGGYNSMPHQEERKGKGHEIKVGGNIFVENDVRITRYITSQSNIKVDGAIFGISDGDTTTYAVMAVSGTPPTETLIPLEMKDPNASSGVFNEGGDNTTGSTMIQATGMYVNGQPFIDFGDGNYYHLWESIGEPFKDVRFFYDLAGLKIEGKNIYLNDSLLGAEIKQNKIWIGDKNRIYAPNTGKISGLFGGATWSDGTPETITPPNVRIANKDQARGVFYLGDYGPAGALGALTLSNLTTKKEGYSNAAYFNQDILYYTGDPSLYSSNQQDMYFKYFKDITTANNLGLRGYMNSKKSIFYGANTLGVKEEIPVLNFDDVIRGFAFGNTWFNTLRSWSYDTPIEYIEGGAVDISKYYIEEIKEGEVSGIATPCPTILINTSTTSSNPLTLYTSDQMKSTFRGIIISKGSVEIRGTSAAPNINIEGSLIVDGGEQHHAQERMEGKAVGLSVIGQDTKVHIRHNPDILLQVKAKDKKRYHQVLDALKITQFKDFQSSTSKAIMSEILGPYDRSQIPILDPIIYTTGRVKLSAHSILEIETQKIRVRIKNMKKING